MFLVQTKIFVILYSFKSAIIVYCWLILYQFLFIRNDKQWCYSGCCYTNPNSYTQAEKSSKFTGVNFKGWQQRVFFWLTALGLQKFTSEDTPVHADDMPDREKFMIIEAWKQEDFLCKGYILSILEDDLYNVYSAIKTSKELWDALEKKYNTEDVCLKKFCSQSF